MYSKQYTITASADFTRPQISTYSKSIGEYIIKIFEKKKIPMELYDTEILAYFLRYHFYLKNPKHRIYIAKYMGKLKEILGVNYMNAFEHENDKTKIVIEIPNPCTKDIVIASQMENLTQRDFLFLKTFQTIVLSQETDLDTILQDAESLNRESLTILLEDMRELGILDKKVLVSDVCEGGQYLIKWKDMNTQYVS